MSTYTDGAVMSKPSFPPYHKPSYLSNLHIRHMGFGIIAQTLVFVKSKPYDISYQKCLKMTEKYPHLQKKIYKGLENIQKRMVLY